MMIARTITYDVDIDGITPQDEQFGGMQGDHQATELVFNLSQDLIERTVETFVGNELILSLQVTDGAGGYHEYEIANTEFETQYKFYIPSAITSAGGVATFYLVWSGIYWYATESNQPETKNILYCFPFKLKFKDTLTVGTPSKQEFLEEGAGILATAKQYVDETRLLKEETQTLVENANESLTALENANTDASTNDRKLQKRNKEAEDRIERLTEKISEADDAKDSLDEILGNTNTVLEELNNIEAALDEIIALQEHFIGGEA